MINQRPPPPNFFISNPELNREMTNALRNLGEGTDKAGDMSVLRVLFSHPALVNQSTLVECAESNKSRHPAATAKVNLLPIHHSELQAVQSLELQVVRAAKRMRKLKGAEVSRSRRKEDRIG
jgi:hypothetical protein